MVSQTAAKVIVGTLSILIGAFSLLLVYLIGAATLMKLGAGP